MNVANRCRQLLLTGLLLLTACGADPDGFRPGEADIAANNRGVGLMGYFDYEGARQVFEQLAREHPDWHDVQVNLAIATLNRQQAGDEQTALSIVERVMAADPGHLRARYVAGLLQLNAGECGAALEHFGFVALQDPRDAYASYYAALCHAQTGNAEQALDLYRRALELDPYLRSAYYGAFQALQRLQRRDEARTMLGEFQRLADNPQARLAEFKYTRMGDKGAAQVVDLVPPSPVTMPDGELFSPAAVISGLPVTRDARASGLSVADVNGDGALDLLLPSTPVGSLLAAGRGPASFEALPGHPLSGIDKVRGALWGDFDNDGLVDVYLLRAGPNQMWRQRAASDWVDVTPMSQTAGGDVDSRDGVLLDADHDGDLDILIINAEGPLELLNNNLDGTFRPLAASQQLTRPGRQIRGVVATDIDSDRDVDLLAIYDSPPHDVFRNDRLWSYRAADDMLALREQALLSAVAGDVDADGQVEIYGQAPDGALFRFRRQVGTGWQKTRLAGSGTAASGEQAQLALADVDGDGRQELLYTRPNGWQVARITDTGLEPVFTGEMPAAGHWMILNHELPGGPSLLGAAEDSAPILWRPGPGRYPFMGLSFTGLEEKADSMRSNASGIGTRVDLRVDSRWSSHTTLRQHAGPGQSLQPLFVGLGGYPQADYIAMTWSDGVFQTELGLAPGQLHRITETQRQLSSCPVLFAWNGKGFAFVSDLLGVGGLGFNTGFGEYAEPRPWENFLLPAGSLAEQDGALRLKITEPMEEVAYLDAVKLRAYDLPAGWDMVLDERMGLAEPLPSGRPVYFRESWLPAVARNERGDDVLMSLRSVDGKAAPVGDRDRRFIGRLAGDHALELEFPGDLASRQRRPWLVIDGWVEYPYSQTGFAAWQANADFRAPSLWTATAGGEWQLFAKGFGYPAGMPRRMSLPLDALPPGTTRLKLVTNLEIYWDRVAVAFEESPPAELQVHSLPLLSATLDAPGFPRRIDGPQRRPHYDFEERLPLWDTRHPRGLYTAFGDAQALVATVDDALAIIGPGEALTLAFGAPERHHATRRLVLEARGWAKDMDLYTRDAGTVGPLPAAGHDPRRRDALHDRYNTRLQAGY